MNIHKDGLEAAERKTRNYPNLLLSLVLKMIVIMPKSPEIHTKKNE